jgi:hypothetical protein
MGLLKDYHGGTEYYYFQISMNSEFYKIAVNFIIITAISSPPWFCGKINFIACSNVGINSKL